MRIHLALSLSVVTAAACSASPSGSSSSTSSTGGTQSSSAVVHHSSGAGGSTSSSSGSAQSGTGSSHAVTGSSSTGTASSAMTCPLPEFTLCDNVLADAVPRTINTNSESGALGIAMLATVGMTRAEVRAAFGDDAEMLLPGEGGGASPLPFRVFYCEKRVSVTYSDQPDMNGNFDGVLSDDDVVHRVAAFEGFGGMTDTGIAVGDPRTEVTAAYGNDSTAYVTTDQPVLGGAQDLYPKQGLAFTHAAGNITAIAVHRPYTGTATPTPLNAALNLGASKVGNLAAALVNGTVFSAVKTALGTPDNEGFATAGSQRIALMSYSNLGLRFVALAQAGDTDVNGMHTAQIYITPPYAGSDNSNALGLGATRAEWDASYTADGEGSLGGVTFTKYPVASGLFGDTYAGVSFVTDEACVERAAVIVLNFISQ